MNQMKRILSLILCLTCGFFTAFAQTDLDDNKVYLEGDRSNTYTLFTGKQWTKDELSFYQFYLVSGPEVFLFRIMHDGALAVFSKGELAILKNYAGKEATAHILFNNGFSADYYVGIKNTTNPEFAENTASITYIIAPHSGDTREIMERNSVAFVEHDISQITVGGFTSDIGIETCRYFQHLVYQYGLIEEEKNEKRSFTPYSVQQNLTLVNMLSKPMGCVSSDLLNDPVNAIRTNLERAFHVDVDDDAHSISVTAFENDEICKNMNYRGVKFSRFRIYENNGRTKRVLYGFGLNKNEGDINAIMSQIARDFQSLGIPMTAEPSSDGNYYTKSVNIDGLKYSLGALLFSSQWDINIEIQL